jgi:cell division septation protein DedD
MGNGRLENQLELFDLTSGPTPRPRRPATSELQLALRYDQLVVAGMAAVIGLTIVFAGGVERGKQLARTERALLVREEPPAKAPMDAGGARTTKPTASPTVDAAPDKKSAPTVPAAGPQPKPRTRLASEEASGVSERRYAIQVVTYSRPELARRELGRLQARGERAFLVIRDGRTVVYVGPFPSKGNAKDKLATLKSRYQDCFVKTL